MARFLHRPEDFRVLHAPYEALLEEHYARHGLDVVHQHPYPHTLHEWRSQRTFLRRRLIEALGLRPELVQGPASERGDLRARVTGRVDRARDGYYVELVEFQSREGFYVSANLYLPADVPAGARLPAVFSPHGHWQAGKHSSHVQLRSINLARRGYVVLVVDTIGHAERRFMGHREPAAHALLYAGESLPGLQVWDNIRALDYLGSRPEVDPTRIGVTGASGGGNHTMYLAAVDERVAVAVPVCSVEMLEVAFRKSQCVCETVPGLLTFADKPHILGLIAPRPLLIMNGMRDGGFPTLSARRAYDHTERIYRLYEGGEARLALYETNVEHSYDRAMRERAYAWFDRWLKEGPSQTAGARSASPGESADLGETETWIEAEEDDTLCVWGAGVHPIPGRSLRSLDPGGGPAGAVPQDAHTLNTYYAAATSEAQLPSPPAMPAAERRRRLTSLFGTWPARAPLQVEHVDTTERSDCAIESLAYWSEAGVPVPSLLFRPLPTPDGRRPAILYTSRGGKARTPERRAVHEIVRAGAIVLAIDYRGQGETAGNGQAQGELPAVERGLFLNRPLFAGRLWDVLRGVEYLAGRPDVDPRAIYVWGEGSTALLALHAAALEEGIAGAACLGLPPSYRAGDGDGPVTLEPWLVVPHLLSVADIPELRALVAPRPCLTDSPSRAAEVVPQLLSISLTP